MNAILRIEAQRGTSRRALGVFELLANIAEAESVFWHIQACHTFSGNIAWFGTGRLTAALFSDFWENDPVCLEFISKSYSRLRETEVQRKTVGCRICFLDRGDTSKKRKTGFWHIRRLVFKTWIIPVWSERTPAFSGQFGNHPLYLRLFLEMYPLLSKRKENDIDRQFAPGRSSAHASKIAAFETCQTRTCQFRHVSWLWQVEHSWIVCVKVWGHKYHVDILFDIGWFGIAKHILWGFW